MRYFVFEFDGEKDMRETAKKLWENHGVTGEMAMHPLPGGKWRLAVNSEKDLRDSTLEKFAQYRVEGD